MLSQENDNTWFDQSHYLKVREIREQLTIPIALLNRDTTHHKDLIGKKIIDTIKRKEYTITEVREHWHIGWYVFIVIANDENSHCGVIWNNISCGSDIILKIIERNKKLYKLKED